MSKQLAILSVICFLVLCAQASMVTRLARYYVYDQNYLQNEQDRSNDGVARVEPNWVIIPDGKDVFEYDIRMFWGSNDQNYIGAFTVKMLFVKEYPLDLYAFTGEYTGDIFYKGNKVRIQTKKVSPVLRGTINAGNAGSLVVNIGNGYDVGLSEGAILDDFAYYPVDVTGGNNPLDHLVPLEFGNAQFAGLRIADYNPTIEEGDTSNAPVCQTVSTSEPESWSNCASALEFKIKEEAVTRYSDSASVSQSSQTTLNVGAEFKIGAKVSGSVGIAKGSVGVERGLSVQSSTTTSVSTETSTSTSTTSGKTLESTFLLPYGRKITVSKLSENCVTTRSVKGCLDTPCTYSFDLSYSDSVSALSYKYDLDYLTC